MSDAHDMTGDETADEGVLAHADNMQANTASNPSYDKNAVVVPIAAATDVSCKHSSFFSKLSSALGLAYVGKHYDSVIAKVRDNSPAWMVNNGSRFCLAFKAGADALSIKSAIKKASPSPWRLAASIVTIVSEGLGMIFPEKDISDEKRASYDKMSRFEFVATKTREAFNPKDYITESAGLALIVNGFCMAMSGVKQSAKGHFSWETAQGVFTSIAGAIMTYWPDRERAWQFAHTTFIVRSVPAARHAYVAWKDGYPYATPPVPRGDWEQGGKWVLNTIANVLGTLYGGVKKMPDGSIVHIGKHGDDVTAPKQSRRLVTSQGIVASSELLHEKQNGIPTVKEAAPKTVVSHAAIDDKPVALATAPQAVSL